MRRVRTTAGSVSSFLRDFRAAQRMSAFVNRAPPHFCLTGASFNPRPGCTRYVIRTHSPRRTHRLRTMLHSAMNERFPRIFVEMGHFRLDAIPRTLVRTHFYNPSRTVLSSLARLTLNIVHHGPGITGTHGR